MHVVQPVTAMLPGCILSVRRLPNSETLWEQPTDRDQLLYAGNHSFMMKSENGDGELPTKRGGQEGSRSRKPCCDPLSGEKLILVKRKTEKNPI